ncbi:hypothetical protein HBB16_10140 [Pseudonocardia sp. MCCB 268]|nr:hypothetical protein [Pseudonocardia cytotoxica]
MVRIGPNSGRRSPHPGVPARNGTPLHAGGGHQLVSPCEPACAAPRRRGSSVRVPNTTSNHACRRTGRRPPPQQGPGRARVMTGPRRCMSAVPPPSAPSLSHHDSRVARIRACPDRRRRSGCRLRPVPGAPVQPGTHLGGGDVWIVDDHQLVASAGDHSSLRAADHAASRPVGSGRKSCPRAERRGQAGHYSTSELGRDRAGDRIDGIGLVRPLRTAGWMVLVLADDTRPSGSVPPWPPAPPVRFPRPSRWPSCWEPSARPSQPPGPPAGQRRQLIRTAPHPASMSTTAPARHLHFTLTSREHEIPRQLAAGRRMSHRRALHRP